MARTYVSVTASSSAERLSPPARGLPAQLELPNGALLAVALHHVLVVLQVGVALAAVEPRALHRVGGVGHEET